MKSIPATPRWLSRKRAAALGGVIGGAVLSWAIATGLPKATHSAHSLIAGPQGPISVIAKTDPDTFVPLYDPAGFSYLLPPGKTKPPPIPPYSVQNATGGGTCGPRAAYRGDHLIDAGNTFIQLYLQGRSALSQISARVRVLSERAPLHTTLIDCSGGANSDEDLVDINLDHPQEVSYVGPVTYEQTKRTPPKPFLVLLRANDYDTVLVVAHTSLQDVRWVLDLVVQSGDHQWIKRIDDNGRPFETSSTADITAVYNGVYQQRGHRLVGQWTRSDPAIYRTTSG